MNEQEVARSLDRVNLYRMWCLGDLGYEQTLIALRRQYPHVDDEVFRGWLDALAPACPLALPPSAPHLEAR